MREPGERPGAGAETPEPSSPAPAGGPVASLLGFRGGGPRRGGPGGCQYGRTQDYFSRIPLLRVAGRAILFMRRGALARTNGANRPAAPASTRSYTCRAPQGALSTAPSARSRGMELSIGAGVVSAGSGNSGRRELANVLRRTSAQWSANQGENHHVATTDLEDAASRGAAPVQERQVRVRDDGPGLRRLRAAASSEAVRLDTLRLQEEAMRAARARIEKTGNGERRWNSRELRRN